MGGAFVGESTALLAVCLSTAPVRTLIRVDLRSGSYRQIAQNVLPRIDLGSDGSFFVYFDGKPTIHAMSIDGTSSVSIAAIDVPTSFAMLEGRRFLYSTASSALNVASWPRPEPVQIATGISGIDAVSPDGKHAIVHQEVGLGGLSDLYAISTSSLATSMALTLSATPNALIGDSPFSADGQYAFWYQDLDSRGAGEIYAQATAGPANDVLLSMYGLYVLDDFDPEGVVLFGNVQEHDGASLSADVIVARRDGRGEPQVLVTGCDGDNFALFPSGTRIVYRVSSGAAAGLWVRDLPASR
jgi:hypothetical protein